MADEFGMPAIIGYTHVDKLGHGAHGDVHHVRKGGNDYALKVLKRAIQRETDFADIKLRHPHIVEVILWGSLTFKKSLSETFILMELCDGGDLNDHILKENLSLTRVVEYMLDMTKGLKYLHDEKIIHRDLKPTNVLMAQLKNDRLVCKLADFGLTKTLQPGQEKFKTECGTPPYMAPEVGKKCLYTFSADIFSLGLVWFVITTKTTSPECNRTLEPILKQKRNAFINELQDDRLLREMFAKTYFKYNHELGNLIADMVSWKPEDRPNAAQVLERIPPLREAISADSDYSLSARDDVSPAGLKEKDTKGQKIASQRHTVNRSDQGTSHLSKAGSRTSASRRERTGERSRDATLTPWGKSQKCTTDLRDDDSLQQFKRKGRTSASSPNGSGGPDLSATGSLVENSRGSVRTVENYIKDSKSEEPEEYSFWNQSKNTDWNQSDDKTIEF